jgi:hypothetical protein
LQFRKDRHHDKNSLKPSCPIVIPREALRSANTFLARDANRLAIPFVSYEQPPTPQNGFKLGNTGETLFVPFFAFSFAIYRIF